MGRKLLAIWRSPNSGHPLFVGEGRTGAKSLAGDGNPFVLRTFPLEGESPSFSAKTSLIRTQFGLDLFAVIYRGIWTKFTVAKAQMRVLESTAFFWGIIGV